MKVIMLEEIKLLGNRISNKLKKPQIGRDYIGGDKIVNEYHHSQEDKFVNLTPLADANPVWYFTGRKIELDSLRKGIDIGEKAVLVSGMGGIGKTQICRILYQEYLAQKGKGIFSHIGYFTYDMDITTTLVKGMNINISSDAKKNREEAWRILTELTKTGRILLFVDNYNITLQKDSDMQRLCQLQMTLVVSSRQRTLSDSLKPYQINFLSMEECKEIYEKIQRAGGKTVCTEEIESLSYVIEELAGFHTITVEFLSFLARTKHWNADRLRLELEKKDFRLQFHKDGQIINIQEKYEILYDLSSLSQGEKNILEAFAVFPYLVLSFETLNRWLLKDAGANEADEIIEGLYQKGWLQFFDAQGGYAMHPVFAKFIYTKYRPIAENHMGMLETCQNDIKMLKDEGWTKSQKYLPFAEKILKGLEFNELDVWAKFSFLVAELFFYAGEYQKSEQIFFDVANVSKAALGESHPNTLDACSNLVMVYSELGKYKEAEELCQKILYFLEEVPRERLLRAVDVYRRLARTYYVQKKYEKGVKLYLKALDILKEELGERHLITASCYQELAQLYYRQEKYVEAVKLYLKALDTLKEELGERHLITASCYRELAQLYYKQEKYVEAVELYLKALDMFEEELGKRHPTTVSCYQQLVLLYSHQKKHKMRKEMRRKILNIRKEEEGETHPIDASDYHELAVIYCRQKKYKEAEEMSQHALDIIKEMLGEKHPMTARCYHNLAEIYYEHKKYKKAEELFLKTLDIQKESLGEDCPETANTYHSLAIIYKMQKKYKKAEELFLKAWNVRRKVLGEIESETMRSYLSLLHIYYKQKKYEKAKMLLQEMLDIQKNMLGEEHPETANTCHSLAEIYFMQKKYKEAEELFLKAWSVRRKVLGEKDLETMCSYHNLAFTYVRQKKYKEEEELHQMVWVREEKHLSHE